ncbi:MAG: hypothetical protein ACI89J_000138 [Hyphomicrobiaceae bacterium]|jgi:hypothetical protein
MKLPAFFEPIVFGLLLSGLMSQVVSGIATWNALGFVADFTPRWLESWLFAWAVAFPSVLVIAPLVRRITRTLVARPTPN